MDSNGNFVDGIEYNIANEAAKSLNMVMKVHIPIDGYTWGFEMGNGEWTGVVGDLQFGRADINWGHLFIFDRRLKIMDFTQWYFIDSTCVMVPRSKVELTKVLRAFEPFQVETWMAFIFTLVLFVLMFMLFVFLNHKKGYVGSIITSIHCTIYISFRSGQFSKYMLYVWSVTIMQPHGMTTTMSKSSLRAVTAIFLLGSFILMTQYAGALKSLLTVTFYPKPINTFRELAQAVQDDDWNVNICCINMVTQMAESSDPSKQYVAKHLKLIREAKFSPTVEAYLNVSDYKTGNARNGKIYATVHAKSSLSIKTRELLLDESGYTDVHIMEDCFYDIAIALGLAKNSPYKESIDFKISQLREGGLIAKWMSESEIGEYKNEFRDDVPFSITDLQGPFYLHIIIMVIASLVFLWEFLQHL